MITKANATDSERPLGLKRNTTKSIPKNKNPQMI